MYAAMLEKARTGEDMTEGERVVLAKMKLQGTYYDIPEALAMPAEGWMLEVVKGGEVAEEVRLDESPFYLLGKDPAVAEIAVAHPSTSRAHCALAHDPDGIGIILTDLGSSNGTFLNHKRLAPHTPTRLTFYPSDELVKPGRSSGTEGKKRNDFFSLGASNRTYHVVPPSALYPTRAEREKREEKARKNALMEAQLAGASRGAEGLLDEAPEEQAEQQATEKVHSRTPTPASKVPAPPSPPATKESRAAPSPVAPKTMNTLLQDDVAIRRPQVVATAAAQPQPVPQEPSEAEAMEVEEAPACADDDVMSDAGMYDAGEDGGGEGALGALREKRLARALTKELSCPGVAAGALWVPLGDVLSALNGAGLPFVVVKQHVKSLVLLDPEQRFGIKKLGGEYSVSLGRVEQSKLAESSLQDSSLEADMDVIHGTSLKAWKRIAKEGLVPGSGSKYMFFTPEEPEEPGIIAGLAKPAQVYIYLDCEKAQADGIKFSKAADGTLCTVGKKGAIKTKYFSQVVSVKSQELLM